MARSATWREHEVQERRVGTKINGAMENHDGNTESRGGQAQDRPAKVQTREEQEVYPSEWSETGLGGVTCWQCTIPFRPTIAVIVHFSIFGTLDFKREGSKEERHIGDVARLNDLPCEWGYISQWKGTPHILVDISPGKTTALMQYQGPAIIVEFLCG
jgi:hypothetical protein